MFSKRFTVNNTQTHRRITDISTAYMMGTPSLKSIRNSISVLISLMVQTSPNEETLSIIHNYYRDAFKGMKGSKEIDEKRMDSEGHYRSAENHKGRAQ